MSKNKTVTPEVTNETAPEVIETVTVPTPEPATTPEPTPEPAPDSEKMATAKKSLEDAKKAYNEARFNPDVSIDELGKLGMTVTRLNGEIDKIKRDELNEAAAAKIKQINEARLALGDKRDVAYFNLHTGMANGADEATLATLTDIYQKAKIAVDEYLTGGVKSVKPATPSVGSATTSAAPKGEISKQIVDIITPMYAEGKSGKEVRAAIRNYGGGEPWSAFNDGTALAAIKKYEDSIGYKN